MRRLASEIIKELEQRVARIEKQSTRLKKAKTAKDFLELDNVTTAYGDEIKSYDFLIKQINKEQQQEEIALCVFFKCLSLSREHNVALKLSRKLLPNASWEGDRKVLQIALKTKTRDGRMGLGRIFTMVAAEYGFKKLHMALKALKIHSKFYSFSYSLPELFNLVFQTISLDELIPDEDVTETEMSEKYDDEVEDGRFDYEYGSIRGVGGGVATIRTTYVDASGLYTGFTGVDLSRVDHDTFLYPLMDLMNDEMSNIIDTPSNMYDGVFKSFKSLTKYKFILDIAESILGDYEGDVATFADLDVVDITSKGEIKIEWNIETQLREEVEPEEDFDIPDEDDFDDYWD